MRLPIDTASVRFAAAGPAEPVLDYESRAVRASRAVSGLRVSGPILLTVEEAAHLLCLGRTTTYELVMRGSIRSVKIGRRRLVVREGLEAFVAALESAEQNT